MNGLDLASVATIPDAYTEGPPPAYQVVKAMAIASTGSSTSRNR